MTAKQYSRRGRKSGPEGGGDDLVVVEVAKDLCSLVMEVTDRSPKKFRFTFVTRMQGFALDILEYLFTANGIYVGPGARAEDVEERRALQQRAITRARLLAYVAEMAMQQDCVLPKHFAEIGRLTTGVQRLTGRWIASDQRRVPPPSGERRDEAQGPRHAPPADGAAAAALAPSRHDTPGRLAAGPGGAVKEGGGVQGA